MLDVRPSDEVERVAIKDAINVPIFVVDEEASFSNLLKQAAALGTGGWWQGGQHMKTNPSFIADVTARLPVDSNPAIVVACQKGLRSLAACEALVGAGYQRVAWLSGGFDSATKTDFETNNGKDPRYGGVAGVRGMIGWTRVQQEEEKALGGAFSTPPPALLCSSHLPPDRRRSVQVSGLHRGLHGLEHFDHPLAGLRRGAPPCAARQLREV